MTTKNKYWRLSTRSYNAWRALKDRCNNKNHEFFYMYGGSGITYCDKWEKFSGFLDDMGEACEFQQIDRINPLLGYTKENCRWVSASHQNANRRSWSKSGYKGVYARPSGRYAAVIKRSGKIITIGTFDSPEDASKAVDAALINVYGEFAMTNKRERSCS